MKLVFMGTPEFAVPSLDMLVKNGYNVAAVITQQDKPKGRGMDIGSPPVKEYAVKSGIKVLQPEKINDGSFISELGEIAPDAIIIVAYGKILPQKILDIPPMGCINVHASLLPKYRGAAPINWAIIKGERKTGITTMMVNAGMDTGDILLQKEVDIPDDITAGELYDKLAVVGAETLKETLIRLENGTLIKIPQNDDEASYAPIIKKDMCLIDWNMSAQDIHNLVRGTNPWPGAHTCYNGRRIKILKTKVEDSNKDTTDSNKTPGTICKKDKNGLTVVCRNDYIRILEVQFESSRKMCIGECWHNFDIGETFG